MKNLIKHLKRQLDFLATLDEMGIPDNADEAFDLELETAERVAECERLAAKLGCDVEEEQIALTPRQGMARLGRLLQWAEGQQKSPALDVHQVASLLGCTTRTVWRHEGKGLLPEARRIGGVVRWDRTEIENWLESQSTQG